jgi:hypothetical protein
MLVQSSASPQVRFDSAHLDQEAVNAILAIGAAAPKDVLMGVEVTRAFAALTDAKIAAAAFQESEMAPVVQQAIEAMKDDPDLASALGQADPKQLQSDILGALQKGLTSDGDPSTTATGMQSTIRDFFNWKDTDNETVIYLEGQPVMTARGDSRGISQRAVQTFWVVLDVCCVVYAILDLPQCRPAKDAVVNLLKKIGGVISAGANRFMSAIRSMLPALSDAQKSGGLARAVKEVASAIARGVAAVFDAIMKNRGGLSALKSITLAVFQAAMSSWLKALYYIGQFVAGAIALISAIGAMVKKIVALVAALAALVYDAIVLSRMGDQAAASG